MVAEGAPKPRRGREPVALPPSQVPTDSWQWGGCSDNVRFGLKKSREFMDSRYRKRSDIKTLIKLHNHHAGRLVIASNDGDSFMPETPSIKRPGKKDIIYSEESPDFCFPNSFGSLGTQSRQCNVSSAGTDSCDQMCCRRGYTKTTFRDSFNPYRGS
ncbi:Protein Wnt [Operophtera brumata]|uniref:Protein Wnt n=1 Tax=Operophtera brumata TaxID=104452 RepID=A0A0L7KQQ0_OPEBR|nr:Protein Wnt [Operophtera brumata]